MWQDEGSAGRAPRLITKPTPKRMGMEGACWPGGGTWSVLLVVPVSREGKTRSGVQLQRTGGIRDLRTSQER